MSRSDNWQTKFSLICQDIRDIKSNNYLLPIKTKKVLNTLENSSTTKVLNNHRPQDFDKSEGDDQDASDSDRKSVV